MAEEKLNRIKRLLFSTDKEGKDLFQEQNLLLLIGFKDTFLFQNQLHFASIGQTAAEIIYTRANNEQPFMGLTTWKNSPKGKILKSDVLAAKNYLNQPEVSKLNLLVTMFIDFAELRALKQQIRTMKDWLTQIEKFLNFNDQQILRNAGKISHEMAIAKATEEYEKYRIQQNLEYVSDFDRAFAKYLKGD